MRVLVVGSGGREHALAWAISASPLADQVYCAPGNAGIAADTECVPVTAGDTAGVIAVCRKAAVHFLLGGAQAPLGSGLADAVAGAGTAGFGPSPVAAALRGAH